MKNMLFTSTIFFASSFFLAGNRAHATPEVGFDFSQTSNTIAVNTLSTAAPNVLRTVTIVCPEAGHSVAIANTLFLFNLGNAAFPGTIAYSLTRGSTSVDSST